MRAPLTRNNHPYIAARSSLPDAGGGRHTDARIRTESVDEFQVTDMYFFGSAYNFENKSRTQTRVRNSFAGERKQSALGCQSPYQILVRILFQIQQSSDENGHGLNARIRPNSLYGIRPRS